MSAVASSATRGCARRRLRTNMLSGSFWQFSPCCWQRERRYDGARQRTLPPRRDVTERAGRRGRRHKATHGRYIQMALAHTPNGGDGEPDVTMMATDDSVVRLTLMARYVPPSRD